MMIIPERHGAADRRQPAEHRPQLPAGGLRQVPASATVCPRPGGQETCQVPIVIIIVIFLIISYHSHYYHHHQCCRHCHHSYSITIIFQGGS